MVEVVTWEYEAAHGKKPRGFGSWAFSVKPAAKVDECFWVHQATYSEARREAVKRARAAGASAVYVQS